MQGKVLCVQRRGGSIIRVVAGHNVILDSAMDDLMDQFVNATYEPADWEIAFGDSAAPPLPTDTGLVGSPIIESWSFRTWTTSGSLYAINDTPTNLNSLVFIDTSIDFDPIWVPPWSYVLKFKGTNWLLGDTTFAEAVLSRDDGIVNFNLSRFLMPGILTSAGDDLELFWAISFGEESAFAS